MMTAFAVFLSVPLALASPAPALLPDADPISRMTAPEGLTKAKFMDCMLNLNSALASYDSAKKSIGKVKADIQSHKGMLDDLEKAGSSATTKDKDEVKEMVASFQKQASKLLAAAGITECELSKVTDGAGKVDEAGMPGCLDQEAIAFPLPGDEDYAKAKAASMCPDEICNCCCVSASDECITSHYIEPVISKPVERNACGYLKEDLPIPEQAVEPTPETQPAPTVEPTPETQPASKKGGDSTCFAKGSTKACLVAKPSVSADAAYEQCYIYDGAGGAPRDARLVLIADLSAGDLILGGSDLTRVVAVQHKAVDTTAEMLTFDTADGASVSMTADHAVFVDGQLIAAAEVKVGSLLSTGAVKRITKSKGAIINAVTASGTILATDAGAPVLAASNPLHIARRTIYAPVARAVLNAALYAAGDVDTVAAGFVGVLTKLVAATATVALGARAMRARKPTSVRH